MALFAMLFSTRSIDASEHHHGMMLASLESLIKLPVFLTLVAFFQQLTPGFSPQMRVAFCVMFWLPRQFQIGGVECEAPDDVRRARGMSPLYLGQISVAMLSRVVTGMQLPQVSGQPGDAWMLNLPLAYGNTGLALLRLRGPRLEQRADLSQLVLRIRRVAIMAGADACAYFRLAGDRPISPDPVCCR